MNAEYLNHNAFAYPSPLSEKGMILLAVLVKRPDGRAVYQAIVPDNSDVDPGYMMFREYVILRGRKCSFEEAKVNFPYLRPSEYAF